MPQAPTANMGLIKPAELGDSGVWASLLDAMFDLIDAHDHSAGKGLKVSMLNGVNVAADIPWNSAGTFYAITGLKAIDFQPQPQSVMTGFAGALFVDSANNELSYRTTGGSIIRFTNGATFNFAAIGAIGGDYSAVGALVDFVDANDLYRFRQQLGGGVQQYARLDCGGVDLFEFKANPAAGVPANRVRLSSPAALAASYEVTWPAATPATTQPLHVDNTGQIIAGPVRTTIKSPREWVVFAGSATASVVPEPGGNLSPVWKLNTTVSGLDTFCTKLDFEPGDALSAFSIDIYGDSGIGDVTDVFVKYYTTQGAALGAGIQIAHITGIPNTPSWNTRVLTIDAPAQTFAAGGVLILEVQKRGDGIHAVLFCYVGNFTQTMIKP